MERLRTKAQVLRYQELQRLLESFREGMNQMVVL